MWDDPHALVTRSRVGTRARTTRGAVLCVDWHIDNCSNKDAGTTVTSHEDRQQEEERERRKRGTAQEHTEGRQSGTHLQWRQQTPIRRKRNQRNQLHTTERDKPSGAKKKEDLSAERVLTHQKRWSFLLRVGFDLLL